MAPAIRKIGNSSGVILPKPALAALGVAEGGAVEFVYEPGRISIVPARRKVREGWAEAAKLIAADGLSQEDIDWLDAPLDDQFNSEGFTEEDMAMVEAELRADGVVKA